MSVPDLKTYIDPLPARFPSAWAKCKAPHDDGEFNARVCAVLYYEHGLTRVGRNGKRGNQKDLSKDIINWRGTPDDPGQNPDPVNGGTGTITDFIASHESPQAAIAQFYPDPNGPGAWVKPLTLAQIDAGGGSGGGAGMVPWVGYDEGSFQELKRQLAYDYARRPQGADWDVTVWAARVLHSATMGPERVPLGQVAALAKHRPEWCGALGVAVVAIPPSWNIGDPV